MSEVRERGTRRQKLTGYLKAANELRQSYQNSFSQNHDGADEEPAGIPGAFPEVKVSRGRDEELILFPSYAKRRAKNNEQAVWARTEELEYTQGPEDSQYWKREWQMHEDENAVVDVDIRGWIYSPHRGPMTRKNRLLFGIARQLSGIPAPLPTSQSNSRASSLYRTQTSEHEEDMAEKEAQQILRRGQEEAEVAGRGGYSEPPDRRWSDAGSLDEDSRSRTPSPNPGAATPRSRRPGDDGPVSGLVKRASWNQPSAMSAEELAIANKHLLARLGPFITNPSINTPLTIFYYDDRTSQSRTTSTDESGHFNFRAALDFVPTHVRVLAGENLSATEEVLITEPTGISLISDIDDTIKHSAISSGAREIFRNTFIRELSDLTIEGVREWYSKMSELGVKLHYVSNSPWQLYPVLVSYFAVAGLPAGSFHLKQYTGMLQGIFEPVAERKKGTLDRIFQDFPERRFILVGDSGEADLELYTEIASVNPSRILAIFIRDVTTPENQGFFDSSMGPLGTARNGQAGSTPNGGQSRGYSTFQAEQRPPLPPRPDTTAELPLSREEDLIDLRDDFKFKPPAPPPRQIAGQVPDRSSSRGSVPSYSSPRRPLPLRNYSSEGLGTASTAGSKTATQARRPPPPPPKPRSLSTQGGAAGAADSGASTTGPKGTSVSPGKDVSVAERQGYRQAVKSKVTSAYNALPSPAAYWSSSSNSSSNPSQPAPSSPTARSMPEAQTALSAAAAKATGPAGSLPAPPVPPRRGITSYPAAAAQYASSRLWSSPNDGGGGGGGGDGGTGAVTPPNRKEELWRRRWARAKEVLDGKGVMLRAWRVGTDVMDDAISLVESANREQAQRGRESKRS